MHNQIQIHTKNMSAKERVRVKWGNTRKLSREVENKLQSGKKTSLGRLIEEKTEILNNIKCDLYKERGH